MIRFLNGEAHAIQPTLYSPAGYIPHPLQSINVINPGGGINPVAVSGAHRVTHILVPHNDYTLTYNFPRRGGT